MDYQNVKTMLDTTNILNVPIDELPYYILLRVRMSPGSDIHTIMWQEIEKIPDRMDTNCEPSDIRLPYCTIKVNVPKVMIKLMDKVKATREYYKNKLEIAVKECKDDCFAFTEKGMCIEADNREDYLGCSVTKPNAMVNLTNGIYSLVMTIITDIVSGVGMTPDKELETSVNLSRAHYYIVKYVEFYKFNLYQMLESNLPKKDSMLSTFNEKMMERYEEKWAISQQDLEDDTERMKTIYECIKVRISYLRDPPPKKKTRRGGKKHKK